MIQPAPRARQPIEPVLIQDDNQWNEDYTKKWYVSASIIVTWHYDFKNVRFRKYSKATG